MSINHRTLSVMIGNAATAPASKAAMVDGELFLVGPDMITAAVVADDYAYVVQRTATGFKYSNKIQRRNAVRWDASPYSAATEMISYVGFDGVSGSIIVNDETEYAMHIIFKHDKSIWSERQHKKTQNYTTGIAATQIEIASGLTAKFISESETSSLASFERLSDQGIGTSVTGTSTLPVINGSDTIALGGTITAGVVVGDYIKLGGVTIVSPIYKVLAFTTGPGGSIVLDQPYQGLDALLNVGQALGLSEAAVDASECGIKITGLVQTFNTLDFYEQVVFELALNGGFHLTGNTNLAENGIGASVSPNSGSGTFEKVFDRENAAQGYEGITNRIKFPIPAFPVYAAAAGTYDVAVLGHDDVHGSSSLNRSIASPMDTIVACDIAGGIAAATGIYGAIDTFLAADFTALVGDVTKLTL